MCTWWRKANEFPLPVPMAVERCSTLEHLWLRLPSCVTATQNLAARALGFFERLFMFFKVFFDCPTSNRGSKRCGEATGECAAGLRCQLPWCELPATLGVSIGLPGSQSASQHVVWKFGKPIKFIASLFGADALIRKGNWSGISLRVRNNICSSLDTWLECQLKTYFRLITQKVWANVIQNFESYQVDKLYRCLLQLSWVLWRALCRHHGDSDFINGHFYRWKTVSCWWWTLEIWHPNRGPFGSSVSWHFLIFCRKKWVVFDCGLGEAADVLLLWGMPFFRHFYTTFDYGSNENSNASIWVAETNANCQPSETPNLLQVTNKKLLHVDQSKLRLPGWMAESKVPFWSTKLSNSNDLRSEKVRPREKRRKRKCATSLSVSKTSY